MKNTWWNQKIIMKNLIQWQEKWIFLITNHQVDKLQMTEWFNQNHLAKVLVWHIDTYKHIIDNIL